MSISRLSLFTGCLGLALSTSAWGTSISLTATADTFVSSANPTTNYGTMGAMQVSTPSASKGEMQSLLKFDLSSVVSTFNSNFGTGNWTIDSITLQLGTNFGTAGQQPSNQTFNPIAGGDFKIDLLANNGWSETAATFSTLSSIEGAGDQTLTNASTSGNTFTYTPVGNTNPPTIPPATYGIGLNSTLLGEITAGGLASFRMYADSTSSVSYLFNQRTFSAQNAPTLIVDAVPEPATLPLLLLSAGTILLRRKRRSPLPTA